MKRTLHNFLAVACTLLLLLAQAEAMADSRHNSKARAPGTGQEAQPQAISRNEAADIAQRATGGRVLSVRENGGYWQVKVLVDDQRVRFVNVDRRSGRVR